ncbi:MAG TPA: amidohydrolase family protein [Candidatus Dormibacteraeota bacterium]|nr:amidohydrolase family protein [Candidatus Dormibacteraeota bacterium]
MAVSSKLRILSADSHICEPGDLWTGYVEPRFRDRAPRIVEDPEKGDIWRAEGLNLPNIAAMGGAGRTSEQVAIKPKFERDIVRGGWDPEQRLKDMDEGGVDAQILFPTAGFWLYGLDDPDLLRACFVAWNNWVRDFCRGKEDRLRGVAFLSVDDVQWAVAEMKRCKEMGLVAANIPLVPLGAPYSDLTYEPLWSAAEDLDMPLTSHTGSVRGPSNIARQPDAFAERFIPLAERSWKVAASTGVASPQVPQMVNELILTGVVERHPRLRIIPTEFDAGWAAFWIDKLDQTLVFDRSKRYVRRWDLTPSELFRRNFALTFINDKTAVAARDIIGLENILWSDDFPHTSEGLWKNTDYVFHRLFDEGGVPDAERRQILGENMTRIFHCFEA